MSRSRNRPHSSHRSARPSWSHLRVSRAPSRKNPATTVYFRPQRDARLEPAGDGFVPDDFYSTTNQRTQVRHDGDWLDVERQRMDSVVVVSEGRAACRKLRDVLAGDPVVCGVDGIRVVPEF